MLWSGNRLRLGCRVCPLGPLHGRRIERRHLCRHLVLTDALDREVGSFTDDEHLRATQRMPLELRIDPLGVELGEAQPTKKSTPAASTEPPARAAIAPNVVLDITVTSYQLE